LYRILQNKAIEKYQFFFFKEPLKSKYKMEKWFALSRTISQCGVACGGNCTGDCHFFKAFLNKLGKRYGLPAGLG
jgi:hypothetical protein